MIQDFIPQVTPDDIREAAYGTTIPAGGAIDNQLDKMIAKAGREILDQVPNLAARVAAGKVSPDTIRDVIEAMVVRVAKNPNAYRHVGIDDFQATLDNSVSAGGLYLSEAERLKLAGPRKARRFGSARLAIPSWRLPHA